VRYFEKGTVLINDYSSAKAYHDYDLKLKIALKNAGLKYIPIPCFPNDNVESDHTSAFGYYINFLRIGDKVFLPAFGFEGHDEIALSRFKELFAEVIQVPCKEIAKEGGVLNCISWTIKQ
jgi:agmatine deiminase